MIIRLTSKLGKKIGITPTESLPADPNPLADWSAHLFTAARTQYILITHSITLYSMVMLGKGVTDDVKLRQQMTNAMREIMGNDGFGPPLERFILPFMAQASFAKALNRSVTGSMNDLILQARFDLSEWELSPYDVSFRLNEIPMSYLSYDSPREAFRKLAGQ
jgi:hypothetical protein